MLILSMFFASSEYLFEIAKEFDEIDADVFWAQLA